MTVALFTGVRLPCVVGVAASESESGLSFDGCSPFDSEGETSESDDVASSLEETASFICLMSCAIHEIRLLLSAGICSVTSMTGTSDLCAVPVRIFVASSAF